MGGARRWAVRACFSRLVRCVLVFFATPVWTSVLDCSQPAARLHSGLVVASESGRALQKLELDHAD